LKSHNPLMFAACCGVLVLFTGDGRALAAAATETTGDSRADSSQTGTSSLAFAAARYSTPNANSQVTVTVDRIDGSSGSATVSYATADGSAVAGKDYKQTSGTLTWLNGDTKSQTINIPIVQSSGGSHFVLVLWNATNAKLTAPATATITIASASTPAPVASSSALSVRVQGDHFIDANSVPMQLRGVNVGDLGFVAVQGWDPSDPWGGDSPDFAAIKTWKANTVRLPLNEASWLGYRCTDATGASRNPDPGHNYQATVKKAVSDATAAGLYVVLDLHWSAPKNFCPLAQNPMADSDNSISFWSSVAATFKTYPNVMFELFNEPYFFWLAEGETDWNVLINGGTMTEYVTGSGHEYTAKYTWKVAGMQQMLDAVRKTGATNVVLIGAVNWSQDLSEWVAHRPTDPEKQIAAVWHAYPDSSTVGSPQAALPKFGSIAYAWTKSVLAAGYPVFITEFGDHNAPGTKGSPFASKLLPWADENGASYTGWTWDPWPERDNVLVKDRIGTPTDGYGVYTKGHYLCAATGSSNCE